MHVLQRSWRGAARCVIDRRLFHTSLSRRADPFTVLGVARNATIAQVKAAYYAKAKTLHPDAQGVRNSGGSTDQWNKVQNAYETIVKRKRQSINGDDDGDDTAAADDDDGGIDYDEFIAFHRAQTMERDHQGAHRNGAGYVHFGQLFDDDFISEMFGDGNVRGENRQRRRREPKKQTAEKRVRKHDDVRATLSLTFTEAAVGCVKSIDVEVPTQCSQCRGLAYRQRRRCGACNGSGMTNIRRTMEVTVPSGVDDTTTLRLIRAIDSTRSLIIALNVAPHMTIRRDGGDLIINRTITLAEAIIGGDVTVDGLQGAMTMTIQPGTQHGDVIRLAGKGITVLNDNASRTPRSGDALVHIKVSIPADMSEVKSQLHNILTTIQTKTDQSKRTQTQQTQSARN